MQHYADNFIPVIPDPQPLHTPEHPFCGDPTCPCYGDNDNIAAINDAINDGIITADDATRIIKGKTV